ncbi:MAG: glycosyltransferase family 39 protein [Anaerolineae bacterium]|nr:glycosyltransferase family 39 protein [Anaerolineae bacterium]
MDEIATRRLLYLLLLVFVALGLGYALVIPPFEGPDEWSHISLVRYLAVHRSLPPRVLPDRNAASAGMTWFLEYHDPPLYYAPPLYYVLGGLLVSWINMDDLPHLMVPSPSWAVGWAPEANRDPRNKNLFAHRAEETFAESGTVRATFLLRLLSLGLGAVTVWGTYTLARSLWRERRLLALGAAAFVAFNPQFLSLAACVSNDNLLNALFCLCLVIILRGVQGSASRMHWIVAGGLAGLGLLTKQSALLLLPLGALAAIWQSGRPLRTRLADGGIFLSVALAVGGWWYIRNALLYGDPLGLASHFAAQAPLFRFGLREAWMTARSWWAAFGWAPLLVEPGLYVTAGLVLAMAGIGLGAYWRPGGLLWHMPSPTRRGLALLLGACGLNGLAFLRWAIATGAPVGRLLFPTLPAVGVLSSWGLAWWTRRLAFRGILTVCTGAALLFAAIVPWRYLRPAYASPRLPNGMPESATPVALTFEGGVQLAGYEPLTGDLQPGREVRLVLYWHALTAPRRLYRAWVQLGPQDPTNKVAEDGFWLGGSLYPSTLWRAGDTVRQEFRLTVPGWAPAPELYWIRVGLVDDTGERVTLTEFDSTAMVLGPWRMRPLAAPAPPTCPADFRLGTAIRLLGYDAERVAADSLTLTLYWKAEQAPGADYTVYVHLTDPEGNLLGQNDAPPKSGAYPTSWWLPGDVVADRHTVHLSDATAGIVRLHVGMYDLVTMERLPAYDGAGRRLPDDVIPLAKIKWEEVATCVSD